MKKEKKNSNSKSQSDDVRVDHRQKECSDNVILIEMTLCKSKAFFIVLKNGSYGR